MEEIKEQTETSSTGPQTEVVKFEVVQRPSKTAYKPGEEISYDGIRVTLNDMDVTEKVTYSVEEGSTWRSGDKSIEVVATYKDAFGCTYDTSFTLKRKRSLVPILVGLLLAVVVGVSTGLIWYFNQPTPDTGSYIIPQGNMTDEEAQKMLDEQAMASRITVSVAPNMRLGNDGQLRVNFVVVEPNNGFSERIEIEQNGSVVYKSGTVEPGYKIEYCDAPQAKVGPATATVYAVDGRGNDTGNPVSVEVQIVDSSFDLSTPIGEAAQTENQEVSGNEV